MIFVRLFSFSEIEEAFDAEDNRFVVHAVRIGEHTYPVIKDEKKINRKFTGSAALRNEETMKKQEELSRELTELIHATKEGKVRWSVEVQTTEGNDPLEKPVEEEDGVSWTLDECYISFFCKHREKDFCMVTYELLKNTDGRTVSSNMVFLPPLGMRFFDLHTLLPFSVDTSAVLLEQIHNLWVLLMDMHRVDKGSIYLNVKEGKLSIED